MIMAMASAIVSFLERRNVIRSESRDVYIYGCDIALYTFLSTAGLLIIGALAGRLWETVVLVTIFYINQSTGGGFHASTHTRCFITMTIGLLVFLALLLLSLGSVVIGCIGLCSCVILYCFPLVLHKNKRHLISKSDTLIRRSHIAVVVQAVVLLGGLAVHIAFAKAIAFSMLLSAASRCAAVALQKSASHH